MFDVGFSELVVIGLVALIVIGPERLPKVARTAGILLGRLQRYVNDVKADINREIQIDELKQLREQVSNQVGDLKSSLSQEMQTAQDVLNQSIAPLEEIPGMIASENTTLAETPSLATGAAESSRIAPLNQLEQSSSPAAEKAHG